MKNICLFKNSLTHFDFPYSSAPLSSWLCSSPSLSVHPLVFLVEILDCLKSFIRKHPRKRGFRRTHIWDICRKLNSKRMRKARNHSQEFINSKVLIQHMVDLKFLLFLEWDFRRWVLKDIEELRRPSSRLVLLGPMNTSMTPNGLMFKWKVFGNTKSSTSAAVAV